MDQNTVEDKIQVKLTRKEIADLIYCFRQASILDKRFRGDEEYNSLRSAVAYLGARINYASKFDADLRGRLREDGLWPYPEEDDNVDAGVSQ
jgi:hypothetical protein